MVIDWYKETKKTLKKDEKIQRSYHIELNNHEGYITLTDTRIIFIRVNGFLRKTYKKTLDCPYEKISQIINVNPHSLEIICSDGEKFVFETLGIPANHIMVGINYYKNTARAHTSNPEKPCAHANA
jgi:hypothetical protein